MATTKHKPTARDTSIGNVPLGSVWVLPPSLTVLYHPLKDNRVNPYMGAGINYTMFYKADSGPIANSISYSNSFGPMGQLGVDFKIADHWVLNADVKKIKMSTDAHVKALGTTLKTNVAINPWVIGVGIGYYID